MVDPTLAVVALVAIVAVVAVAPAGDQKKPPLQVLLAAIVEIVKRLGK